MMPGMIYLNKEKNKLVKVTVILHIHAKLVSLKPIRTSASLAQGM